jgi:hypothetical protein
MSGIGNSQTLTILINGSRTASTPRSTKPTTTWACRSAMAKRAAIDDLIAQMDERGPDRRSSRGVIRDGLFCHYF